ncbi:MAG: dTMP kinase [Parcubacteria bacterium C7867-005]|nr:MAG: dTMP kinase [Parcubacteria bacterium C7867-005]
MRRGSFVVVEGGEGSGKSTHLKRYEKYAGGGAELVVTREPGGTPIAEEIRGLLFSERGKDLSAEAQFHLFWAARADHLKTKIMPALLRGANVVSDRFDASTFAYQIWGEEHHGLISLFRVVREEMMSGVVAPIYVYLDIDPEIGLGRKRRSTDTNSFDDKDLEFHKRVRRGYGEFSEFARVIQIDASRDIEEVWEDFRTTLDKLLA